MTRRDRADIAARAAGSILATKSSVPRRRAFTSSAVSTVLAPPIAREGFARARGDELVENGSLAVFLAQNASEPLDVLAHRTASRKNHGHIGIGHVDALVQYPRGDHRTEASLRQAGQNSAPFLDL